MAHRFDKGNWDQPIKHGDTRIVLDAQSRENGGLIIFLNA
jgi:hypothetical protein